MSAREIETPSADGDVRDAPEQDEPFRRSSSTWTLGVARSSSRSRGGWAPSATTDGPDFYYRQASAARVSRCANRMISLHALDEARQKQVTTPGRRLSNQMSSTTPGHPGFHRPRRARARGRSARSLLHGGRHVLCVAGQFPEHIRASPAHDQPDQRRARLAARLARQFRGGLYCGFAETDPYAPLSM